MAAKRARRFRFFLNVLLVLMVIAVVLVVLLETGHAGRYVLRMVGRRMGMEIQAHRVRIGLDGRLRIIQLSAALEEGQEPFFSADTIIIRMNNVKSLLTTFELNISKISLAQPMLALRRDEQGTLNIACLLDHRTDRPKRSGPAVIPDVYLINGTFLFEQAGQTPRRISDIAFNSTTDSAGRLKATLSLPGNNTVDGLIDLETLDHRIAVNIQNAAALPEAIANPLGDLNRLKAQWDGRIVSQPPWMISGDVLIENLSFNKVTGSLQAQIAVHPDHLAADIERLAVDPWAMWESLNDRPEAVTADKGTIRYTYADSRIDMTALELSLLGGKTVIDATAFAQQPQQSRVEIEFTEIQPAPLLSGTLFENTSLSGAFNMSPASDRRAMEPMAISLRLRLHGPLFQAADLEEISAEGYLGDTRLVTHSVTIPVFGGVVSPWISVTRRDEEVFTHLITDFERIDIDRLVHTIYPEAESVPGVLSGTARCRTLGSLQTLSGSADIALTDSDLMQTNIIGAVYAAMNLSFGRMEPRGQGKITLTAQSRKVDIMSFEYFNRGVDIRGAGEIEDITQGKASPISGFVTGSLRPLRDTRIPGRRELDRLISGLQTGLATIKVEGTVGEPAPRVVPMPEIHNAFRALLWQQLRE
ncbi:MAG TPA: hypothetical protein ENN97_03385 [Phycisphaerales bacterium]|nr:hypothetical protein [Phycisphaerales bacterium]